MNSNIVEAFKDAKALLTDIATLPVRATIELYRYSRKSMNPVTASVCTAGMESIAPAIMGGLVYGVTKNPGATAITAVAAHAAFNYMPMGWLAFAENSSPILPATANRNALRQRQQQVNVG